MNGLRGLLDTAGVAARCYTKRNAPFRVTDIKCRGIDQSRLYLRRVSGLDIASDPSWQHLVGLRDLRNISESKEQQQAVDRLLGSYQGKLAFPEAGGRYGYGEIWVSMPLCLAIDRPECSRHGRRIIGKRWATRQELLPTTPFRTSNASVMHPPKS
jgi:hypothetical protein